MDWCGPAIGEVDVAAFEQQYGCSLPDDYRRFLLEVNGGRLANEHTTFHDGIVNILFSLGLGGDDADLLESALFMRPRLPSPDLLPIGFDDGGRSLLLGVAGEHRGEVWLENRAARPEGSNPRAEWFRRRDMKKLADSFEAFLRMLRPTPVYVPESQE